MEITYKICCLVCLVNIIRFFFIYLFVMNRAQKYKHIHDKVPMQRILYSKEIGSNINIKNIYNKNVYINYKNKYINKSNIEK